MPMKNPDPGGREPSPGPNNSSPSAKRKLDEESERVLVIDEGKTNGAAGEQHFLQRQQQVRESFLETRRKVLDSQQKLVHSMRLLDPSRTAHYQERIQGYDRQILYYNDLIKKLDGADKARTSPRTDADDAQLLGLNSSGAVEIRRVYGPPAAPSAV